MRIKKGLDIPEAYKVPLEHDLRVDWSKHLPKDYLHGWTRVKELEAENKKLKAQIASLENTLS